MTKRYEFIKLPLPSERQQKQRNTAIWTVLMVVAVVILVRVL